MSERYNGWVNFETWRVNLEIFDGYDPTDFLNDYDLVEDRDKVTEELAASLENMADELIASEIPSQKGIAYDLAQSFLAKVDFQEIAENMVADYIAEVN